MPNVQAETVAALQKDRSEKAGIDYCPQYTVWVRHLDFKEHWEERKMYVLERDNKKFLGEINKATRRTQITLAFLAAFVAMAVAGANVWASANQAARPMKIEGAVPIVIVTPLATEASR